MTLSASAFSCVARGRFSRPVFLLLISLELTNCQWVAMCAYFFFFCLWAICVPLGVRALGVQGGR